MGCGGSTTVSREQAVADKRYFESVAKLRDKRSSVSIEEARKRREECAKHRSRRASVMGLLEAEKLTQRKRSVVSMYNYSASDVSAEINVPPFLPNVTWEAKEFPHHAVNTESSISANENDEDIQKESYKPKIRITLSNDAPSRLSRSSDSGESNGSDLASAKIYVPKTDNNVFKEHDKGSL